MVFQRYSTLHLDCFNSNLQVSASYSITLDGKKFWLSGWKRHGDDGKPWPSLTVETADDTDTKPPQRTYAQRRDAF